ncbi:MAG: TonB-dependent receptor, partial [Pseudomonadota bacterium]
MKPFQHTTVALCVVLAFAQPAIARQQDESPAAKDENTEGLERIEVTATKRVQSIQDVPISISTLTTEELRTIFSSNEDIRALAIRVPGLYAESSNGRVAPRFYIRGLGNSDFDLAASQPVSIIMDDVVMENTVLKSFPIFDIEQVEVIRGPQGTLFGRNTTAGIVKFDSVKPSQDFDAYVNLGAATRTSYNVEAAVGGGITDTISGRISILAQERDDYIINGANRIAGDVMGGFYDNAFRAQLLIEPSDRWNILFNLHARDYNGTAEVFRANVFTRGSNELNENYDRELVFYDANLLGNAFDNNPQEYENLGYSLKLEYDFSGKTLTSIIAFEEADGFSLGDIDGGFGSAADFTPDPRPGFIPFDAVTRDALDDLQQFTQEIRLASDTDKAYSWQVGLFYFNSSFDITSTDGFFGATTVTHENDTWAVFGQGTYDITNKLTVTAGLRYTYDEKSLEVGDQNVDGFAIVTGDATIQDYEPVDVDDGQVGFELSANYAINDNMSIYARYANGFRAQSIQGRDIAFEGNPSVAEAETINSVEAGVKADLLDNTLRINAAAFAYVVDDIQLSAIGGQSNGNSLLNADKGEAFGYEIEAKYLATDNLVFTVGFALNETELKDDDLQVAVCGANCTVLDPVTDGLASVDGNPFPNAPRTTFNATARYAIPLNDSAEFFIFTDWAVQGETNFFLYDAV